MNSQDRRPNNKNLVAWHFSSTMLTLKACRENADKSQIVYSTIICLKNSESNFVAILRRSEDLPSGDKPNGLNLSKSRYIELEISKM